MAAPSTGPARCTVKPFGMTVLVTPRLSLDHISLDDAEFIRRLLNEPSFLRYIGDRGVRTPEDARHYIANGPLDSYARFGFGLYLARRREDGVPAGICGVLRRPALDNPDLGYAFVPEYWRLGYAREAATAVLAHARDDLHLTRLSAIVSPDNLPSIALLESLGFQLGETRSLSPDASPVHVFATTL